MKKVVRLNENDLTKLVRKILTELDSSSNRNKVLWAQDWILTHEIEKGYAKYLDNNPTGCKKPRFDTYLEGEPNQCKISGSKLCNGECFQKEALDAYWGPKTEAAYNQYKDEQMSDGQTLEQVIQGDSYSDEYTQASINQWQIPVTQTSIKAFQWYVWKKMEAENEKEDPNCTENCKYRSILCGNNFCNVGKAVDGYWGTNTKNAWDKYKQNYYDDGFYIRTTYEGMPDEF